MIAVDTNVLVYAHRRGFPLHAKSLSWLRRLAEGGRPWALPVFCIGEFLRVVTHPRVLDPPSTMAMAWQAIRGLLQSPSVRVLSPGARYVEILEPMILAADVRGNLVYDAQIAALCIEHGASKLLTCDRDFTRFSGLEILTPEDPPS